MTSPKSEALQGTLDMLVLKTLESIGPMHGWGMARRIQQLSDNSLRLEKLLDQPQPRISELLNGKISKMSAEKLAGYLSRLGVEIKISARKAA